MKRAESWKPAEKGTVKRVSDLTVTAGMDAGIRIADILAQFFASSFPSYPTGQITIASGIQEGIFSLMVIVLADSAENLFGRADGD